MLSVLSSLGTNARACNCYSAQHAILLSAAAHTRLEFLSQLGAFRALWRRRGRVCLGTKTRTPPLSIVSRRGLPDKHHVPPLSCFPPSLLTCSSALPTLSVALLHCSVCVGMSASRCLCSVVAVEAARAGDVGLAVHPDLTDDALTLLQPLGPLQLLGRREHVGVERPFEASVPPG